MAAYLVQRQGLGEVVLDHQGLGAATATFTLGLGGAQAPLGHQDLPQAVAIATGGSPDLQHRSQRLVDPGRAVAASLQQGVGVHQQGVRQRGEERGVGQRDLVVQGVQGLQPRLEDLVAGRILEHRPELGQKHARHAGLLEQLHGPAGGALAQKTVDLLEHARLGAGRDVVPVAGDGLARLGLDGEIEPGGELDGPQDAHRILLQADVRVPDGPNKALLQVGPPLHEVDHLPLHRIVKQAVEREVPTQGVIFGRAEDVVAADEQRVTVMEPLLRGGVAVALFVLVVAGVLAEGGGLDDLGTEKDVGQLEATSDDARVAKQPLDLVGRGRGGQIEVLGLAAEQQIAHTAPHQVGLVAIAAQTPDDLQGVRVDVVVVYGILKLRHSVSVSRAPGVSHVGRRGVATRRVQRVRV